MKKALATVCLCLGIVTGAMAQQGTVSGTVVDAANGDPLIGVNVILAGTTTGDQTDLEGRYIFKAPVGTYTLSISYIGFKTLTIADVIVRTDDITKIDIQLEEEVFGFDEEVVVEARALTNAEGALLRVRQKAGAVSDAISAEAISKSGSSNAADAMSKVTGASVIGGKYVYVRGLGERYSSTHLNGVELPSADPDKKAFNFDLFPSGMLDNIVTLKTFTPDKPGNFSGGLVDIGTQSFPEQRKINVSLSSALNTTTNFGADFYTYAGGNRDWLAYDDGSRAIPNLLADSEVVIPNAQQARFDGDLAQQLDVLSKSFNNVMAPTVGTAPMNQSYGISMGNQRELFGQPLGYLLGVNYSYSASAKQGKTGRYVYAGGGSTQLENELAVSDNLGTIEAGLSGLFNLSYAPAPAHELSFNTIYSRTGESTARYQEGIWPKEYSIDDLTTRFENRVLQYIERDIYSFQLRGKHAFTALNNATVEWKASTAQTRQDEPDLRLFASVKRVIGDREVYTARHSGFADPSRYFRKLDEGNQGGDLDVSIPFKQWDGQKATVKIGAAYNQSDRQFSERIFAISPANNYANDPETYFGSDNTGIIQTDEIAGGQFTRYTFGNVVTDRSKLRNNYTGDQTIAAGYAMVELPITRQLRLIGGARYETTDIRVVSEDPNIEAGRIDNKDWLPSVNLVYQLGDMNLRAAFTRTLARPVFREVAPYESVDFLLGSFIIGNPELKRTLISNVDLRWEWFTRPGELFAVSTFFKDLENPIERAIIGGTNGQIQFQNVPQARIMGVEVEIRKRLDQLSDRLARFSLGANVSLVRSEIDVPETELAIRRAIDPNASAVRTMQGQSPYLVNMDLSYNNDTTGSLVGLYFNVFGSRLSAVSQGGTPDVFERPRPQLDLIASQRVLDHWNIKLSAKNLLNSTYKETYRFLGQDFTYYEYSTGRTFSLSVSYSLN